MRKFKIEKALNLDEINYINGLNDNVMLIFANTKIINPEIIKLLKENVTISVQGGLAPQKRKYNNANYQYRTYYSSNEIATIIEQFQKIEKRIHPNWSELKKAMFVYKALCEKMIYSECTYNGRDSARNLLGMITQKSVCAGFTLIFKEAMDRINIECYYQNRQGHQSWNILKIDDKYYSVELSWDVYNKKNNNCYFEYFCRENIQEFYHSERENHHDISEEDEEIEYPLTKISKEEFLEAYNKIQQRSMFTFREDNGHLTSDQINVSDNIKINKDGLFVENKPEYSFTRNDGSNFFLMLVEQQQNKDDLNVYLYVEKIAQGKYTGTFLYSEQDLLHTTDEIRDNIANELLSKNRVDAKVTGFNGYIGYLIGHSKTRK